MKIQFKDIGLNYAFNHKLKEYCRARNIPMNQVYQMLDKNTSIVNAELIHESVLEKILDNLPAKKFKITQSLLN